MSLSKMSLLDIPDLPMIKILKDCDFMSLMVLRKTCHNLRNFIDYLAPETEITKIQIIVKSDEIRLLLSNYQNYLPPLDVTYRKCSQGGCELEFSENHLKKEWNDEIYRLFNAKKVKKYIKDADFMDVFCMDLAVILSMQRTKLDILEVSMESTERTKEKKEPKKNHWSTGLLSFFGCCSRSRSKLKTIIEDLDPDINFSSMFNRIYDRIELSSQSRPLRVEKVILDAIEQRQILQVLPYTDSLELRYLLNVIDCEAPIELEIDELVKLKQWKMMKNFWMVGFKLKGASIEDLAHFESATVEFDVVTASQFLLLKEKFLTTPNSLKFYLFFHNIENRDRFYEIVGHPNFPNIGSWKFPIPGTNQYLHVKRFSNCFQFERRTYQ